MATLYEKLHSEMLDKIEKIKELRAQARAENYKADGATDADTAEKHYNAADALWAQADVLHEEVHDVVENAYYEAPFAKARDQGKAAFWSLAGIM